MISLVKKHSKEDRMNSEYSESEKGIKLEEISTKPNDEEIERSECIYENSAYCECCSNAGTVMICYSLLLTCHNHS